MHTERALDAEAAGERAGATSWRRRPPRLPGVLPVLMPARQAAAWGTRTVCLLCCTLPAPCLAQAADRALWRVSPSPAHARAGRACWQHPAQHWARIRQAAHRFAQGVLRFKGDEAIVLPRAVAAHARRYGGQVVAGNAAAGAGRYTHRPRHRWRVWSALNVNASQYCLGAGVGLPGRMGRLGRPRRRPGGPELKVGRHAPAGAVLPISRNIDVRHSPVLGEVLVQSGLQQRRAEDLTAHTKPR